MLGLLETKDGDRLAAVRSLLRTVLMSGDVDALLVALRHPAEDAVTHALVRDPALLDLADPFAPVLPVNGARLVSMLTQKAPRPRIAAVLRNCEIRALVELVKLQQANMEGLTLIGVECTGTYEVRDYAQIARGAVPARYSVRPACQMCEHPLPTLADITIRRIGIREIGPDQDGLYIEARDAWAGRLGLTETAEPAGRAEAVGKLIADRTTVRDRMLAEVAQQTATPAGLAEMFSTCIRCHNCMTNCPICYCKTCFFKTDVFDHEPMQFLGWAERKGAARLPADTVLFHLTRMNHMATSCVGCGFCTAACPVGINVGSAFRAVAGRTQAIFGYEAGRSLDEVPPVKTFQVDELREVGEK